MHVERCRYTSENLEVPLALSRKVKMKKNKTKKGARPLVYISLAYIYAGVSDKVANYIKQQRSKDYTAKSDYPIYLFCVKDKIECGYFYKKK